MGDKQQINLMAYKIVWPESTLENIDRIVLPGGQEVPWNIFADTPQGAWCREQVVKALGEKHDWNIAWDGKTVGWSALYTWSNMALLGGSYIEAIAAAVQHVSKS